MTCGKPTHHLCANTVFMHDELSKRYCSMECVDSGEAHESLTQQLYGYGMLPSEPPSVNQEMDQAQAVPVRSFVKTKKVVKKPRKPRASTAKPDVDAVPKQKRKSPLEDLRKAYVGKILELPGVEVTGIITDTTIYKFHVTEINRKKIGDKLVPVIALTCETNPLISMDDVPLDRFKMQLDAAPFDERRILHLEVSKEREEELINNKKKKRRRIHYDLPATPTDNSSPVGEEVEVEVEDSPLPDHVYSDEEEEDMPAHAFTFLDSIGESRRGLDVDDAEPTNTNEIPELPVFGGTVEEMKWTRADFNDIPTDDPDAYAQTTRPSAQGIAACTTPLSLLLFFLPHCVWNHIARCSEMKRVAFLAALESNQDTSRRDRKYLKTPIQAKHIFAFVLVLVLNMLQPFAGGVTNHWRTDNSFIRRAGIVPSVMSRDEFRCIRRCLCFYDPRLLDANDKFTKIR